MPQLLVCPNCAGPLPAPSAAGPYVTCIFCGSTASVTERVLIERHDGDDVGPPAGTREMLGWKTVRMERAERAQVWATFREALDANRGRRIPYEAFRDVVRQHVEAFNDSDVLARVTYKLALAFEQEHGCKARSAEALWRLADAYVSAIDQLRRGQPGQINLPFFVEANSKPLHYQESIDVATITALAESDPVEPAPAPRQSKPRQDEPSEKPRRRGFFSKLFG
jgi:hypothetical protein